MRVTTSPDWELRRGALLAALREFARLMHRRPFDTLAAARPDSLAFFDDHQHKLPRLLQCKAAGIRHVIFDDNLAAPYTHRTLEHELAADPAALERDVELYEVFPALWPVDLRVGDLHIHEAGMNFPVDREL